MESLTFRDYLAILVRRRAAAMLGAAAVLAIALAFAFLWPPKYRSTATIQILQPDIPHEVTEANNEAAVVEAFADQRIQRINERITSSSNLVDVITKLNLYPELRQNTSIGGVVYRMQQSIKLSLLSADLANPNAAGRLDPGQLAAIAFTISFSYPDPLVAQETDNELVSRFLDEDLRIRREQARSTSAFLAEQIARMETALAQQEAKMSDFMSKHSGGRQDDLSFNMQQAAQALSSLSMISQQLDGLNQQKAAIEQSLSTTQRTSVGVSDGQILLSPATQLKSLQAKYASLTAEYGPHHPDLIALKRQIDALQASLGQHTSVQEADNPAWLVLQSQARSIDAQIKLLRAQQADLQRQHDVYERRVSETPAIERDYAALSRDYDNAQIRYRELKEKKMAADMSLRLEQDRKGERLAVIEAANLPTSPYMPPRKIVLALGLILAAGSSLGCALLAETMSGAVHSPKHLAALVGAPPLVTIPVLLTKADRINTRNQRLTIAAGSIAVLGMLLFLYNQFVMPLDVAFSVIGQHF